MLRQNRPANWYFKEIQNKPMNISAKGNESYKLFDSEEISPKPVGPLEFCFSLVCHNGSL